MKKRYTIPILVTVLICLWGGIYDFTFALYGIVVFGGLLYVSRKKFLIPFNVTTYGLGILLLAHILSVCVAQDKGMALIGVLRIVMMIGFWLLWNNLNQSLQKIIWNDIPDIAALLTVITIILYFIPPMREYLFQAGRMGGVFQYSNTYALFLLASVVILFYREGKASRRYTEVGILLIGIVFCGSRSVMVLAVITIAAVLVLGHVDKKIWISVLAASVLVCIGLQLILQLDIQRLLKLSMDSSTLNGRFLYWQDALQMIGKNPLGLGYMGYYFLQPQFQTGNYVTKFVHNDILQFGLDAGILAAVIVIVMIAANIWNKNNAKQNRIILTLLFLHCLFDFDLQFSAMFCFMLMCMGGWQEKNYECKGIKLNLAFGILTVLCVYFSVALGLAHFGENEIALAMYPGNTFARESRMQEDNDGEDAELIIERNGMLITAYDYAARQHMEKTEYLEAYEDIQGMLKTAGYRVDYYNQAVYYLSIALDQAIKNGDSSGAQKILEEIQEVPKILARLEERTSSLAYKINDKPVLELDEEIEEYIENLSGISLM